MGQSELVVVRDERGRVASFSFSGAEEDTFATRAALHLIQTAVTSLKEYLHVDSELIVGTEVSLVVDRSDVHLNREIDAIMETLLIGVRVLAAEYPDEVAIHTAEASITA